MSLARKIASNEADSGALLWVGQSGRHYRLLLEVSGGFQLRDACVHVLVAGDQALWAGSERDVVSDPQSRSHFRKAMSADVVAYRLEPTPDEDQRSIIAWDIVHGAPAGPLRLVDAD